MMKTPKEKAVAQAKIEKAHQDRYESNKRDMNFVAGSIEGVNLYKFLMEFCHYQKEIITMDAQTGEVNDKTTAFLCGRRSVYLELRKYLSAKNLKKIEFK